MFACRLFKTHTYMKTGYKGISSMHTSKAALSCDYPQENVKRASARPGLQAVFTREGGASKQNLTESPDTVLMTHVILSQLFLGGASTYGRR